MGDDGRIILLTTAPRVYDGFGTEERSARVGRDTQGREIRKVAVWADSYEWQFGRYRSGMHGCVTPADASIFVGSIWQLDQPEDR